jgi:c(7)-type cytochrome triheme protein
MKRTFSISAVFLVAGFVVLTAQQAKKPPEKLVFKAAIGNVTFDHAKHAERVKGNCKTCHPGLFQQSATVPLNFKANMHKTAEANKTSCAHCHVEGGAAFAAKGNCQKCHKKG